jgi:hypothetical protein
VITRAARSADDRTAGKSSTTNRLLTFRMLAYGPFGGKLGAVTGALPRHLVRPRIRWISALFPSRQVGAEAVWWGIGWVAGACKFCPFLSGSEHLIRTETPHFSKRFWLVLSVLRRRWKTTNTNMCFFAKLPGYFNWLSPTRPITQSGAAPTLIVFVIRCTLCVRAEWSLVFRGLLYGHLRPSICANTCLS